MLGQIYEERLMRFISERNVQLLAEIKCVKSHCELVTLQHMICLWSSTCKYC